MDEKIEETVDEATQKLMAERKARRERHAALKCKVEENEGVLDRKRIAINDMQTRYMHGLVDLTFFAGSSSLRDRAEHERRALHSLVDEMTAARKDYDDGVEANQKLVDEAHKLCEEIEKDEGSGFSSVLGGILGGFGAYALGSAFSKMGKDAKDAAPKTEPAPPPSSGGETSGTGEPPP